MTIQGIYCVYCVCVRARLTVIGGEDHYGIVGAPRGVQRAEQPAHLGVQVRHGSVVVLTDTQLERGVTKTTDNKDEKQNRDAAI